MAANDDDTYLYHVTYFRNIPSIATDGLVRSSGLRTNFADKSAWCEGKVFLTTHDGVGYWYNIFENLASHYADSPLDEGFVPVVLKILVEKDDLDLHDDREAANVAQGEHYFIEEDFEPEDLEVWDGYAWVALDEARIDPTLAFTFEDPFGKAYDSFKYDDNLLDPFGSRTDWLPDEEKPIEVYLLEPCKEIVANAARYKGTLTPGELTRVATRLGNAIRSWCQVPESLDLFLLANGGSGIPVRVFFEEVEEMNMEDNDEYNGFREWRNNTREGLVEQFRCHFRTFREEEDEGGDDEEDESDVDSMSEEDIFDDPRWESGMGKALILPGVAITKAYTNRVERFRLIAWPEFSFAKDVG